MQEYIKVIFRTGRDGYYLNNKEYSIEPDVDVIVKVERGEDIAAGFDKREGTRRA